MCDNAWPASQLDGHMRMRPGHTRRKNFYACAVTKLNFGVELLGASRARKLPRALLFRVQTFVLDFVQYIPTSIFTRIQIGRFPWDS